MTKKMPIRQGGVMHRILSKKTGVTLLEGLIAMGLLALVSVATFSVLLSISRRASQPDIREEMLLAVERAQAELQKYPIGDSSTAVFQEGLCGDTEYVWSTSGSHSINCMLPPICYSGSFSYTVELTPIYDRITGVLPEADRLPLPDPANTTINPLLRIISLRYFLQAKVNFQITCNGYSL